MSNDPFADLKDRVTKIEACITPLMLDVSAIKASLDEMKANFNTTKLLIQWIIMPLIVILGALVGVKVVFPGV